MDRGAQFQPVHAGHADVGDDDAGKVAVDARQHAARVGEGFDRQHGEVERSEEHTSELQSLVRNSYAVFCLKKKTYTEDYKRHFSSHERHYYHVNRLRTRCWSIYT